MTLAKRFTTEFGWTGGCKAQGELKPYVAHYRFLDRTWSIRIWAHTDLDAKAYCWRHGLKFTGKLVEEIE